VTSLATTTHRIQLEPEKPSGSGKILASDQREESAASPGKINGDKFVREQIVMSVADIGRWLGTLGFPEGKSSFILYARAFKKAGVDAAAMNEMKTEDLRALGVTPKWHVSLILAKWASLTAATKRQSEPFTPAPKQLEREDEEPAQSPTALDEHPALVEDALVEDGGITAWLSSVRST
jgi:hypothetical protein